MDQVQEILAGIRAWVEVETPSDDAAAVNRLMDVVEAALAELGLATERISGRAGYGDHVKARLGPDEPGGILVLAHLDTVWPKGTLEAMPFRVEGDRAYGPGVCDMKGGAYLGVYALRELLRSGRRPRLPVTLLYTSDEEAGSPTSRRLIQEEALRHRYVLVLEPGVAPAGAVKTARKGWGRFHVWVEGRAAHAGADHASGRSAVVELARQILALEAMTDYGRGTTVNVGVVMGGTRPNVVPAHAQAEVDLRVATAEEAERMTAAILGLRPMGEGVRVRVTGGMDRPPFERTEGVARLYSLARELAAAFGYDLPETSTGGVSDGNLTAALGVPTLDGLGVVGAGMHAEDEHLLISHLVPRARLLMALLESLA